MYLRNLLRGPNLSNSPNSIGFPVGLLTRRSARFISEAAHTPSLQPYEHRAYVAFDHPSNLFTYRLILIQFHDAYPRPARVQNLVSRLPQTTAQDATGRQTTAISGKGSTGPVLPFRLVFHRRASLLSPNPRESNRNERCDRQLLSPCVPLRSHTPPYL